MTLDLNYVKVFPRSTPISNDDGHLINEKNITRLVRVASHADSYFVSNNTATSGSIEFVLKGYYITLAATDVKGKFVTANIEDGLLTGIEFSNESGDLQLKDDNGTFIDTVYQILNCGSSTTII